MWRKNEMVKSDFCAVYHTFRSKILSRKQKNKQSRENNTEIFELLKVLILKMALRNHKTNFNLVKL